MYTDTCAYITVCVCIQNTHIYIYVYVFRGCARCGQRRTGLVAGPQKESSRQFKLQSPRQCRSGTQGRRPLQKRRSRDVRSAAVAPDPSLLRSRPSMALSPGGVAEGARCAD